MYLSYEKKRKYKIIYFADTKINNNMFHMCLCKNENAILYNVKVVKCYGKEIIINILILN